jgi:5-methyltetrahydropteroyltriglutamate--homocysteine methyltransferase
VSRILTTHAGSLPRPRELDARWAAYARGEPVDGAELDALVARATADVVARQAAVGIDIAGNGEQGRESFFTHVRDRFSGFGGQGELRPFRDIREFPAYFEQRLPHFTDPDSVSLAQLPAAVDEVRYLGTAAIDAEIAALQLLASDASHQFADLFLTAPSPGIVATGMTNRHYATIEDYVDALAEGLAHEYRAIVDAGLVLQIDAPDLALERHVLYADRPLADFVAFARHVIAAINRAIDGLPQERIRLHVCWGNYDGPHCFDVPLADMIDTYCEAAVGALVLSMANPRHAHEYRLLDRLPPHVAVVVGCIDTTSNYVEHPQVVADRLARAADALGDPSRVSAGTDCGFATAAGLRDVAPDVVWVKLRALVEGAALAGDQLFG